MATSVLVVPLLMLDIFSTADYIEALPERPATVARSTIEDAALTLLSVVGVYELHSHSARSIMTVSTPSSGMIPTQAEHSTRATATSVSPPLIMTATRST